jgi:hypothetical protein
VSADYEKQLAAARRLLEKDGREALNNPHAMIGRQCGCRDCFTCAALEILYGPHAVIIAGRRAKERA